MIQEFYSLFFPRICLNCAETLTTKEEYLCLSCSHSLPLTDDVGNDTNELLQKFVFEPKIKSAVAYIYFEKYGISQKVLHHLKYGGGSNLGVYFGEEMGHIYPMQSKNIDLIIPVPIHKRKKKARGYNQSACLAEGFSKATGIAFDDQLILRHRFTQSQTRKSKIDRWENIEKVYSEVSRSVKDQTVLIIDDVITTGATVGMLAQRLSEAGVKAIHILCLARGK